MGKCNNMKIDDYDLMIEKATEDLKDEKYQRDYWYMKMSETIGELKKADDFVKNIENTIAYYKGLRENAIEMGEDDEN